MLKDVVSWDTRITTGNSGSKTYRDLCMRECHRRSFSLCLSTGTLRKAPSLSTKDSKRMANKRVQAMLYSAPDPRCCAQGIETMNRRIGVLSLLSIVVFLYPPLGAVAAEDHGFKKPGEVVSWLYSDI